MSFRKAPNMVELFNKMKGEYTAAQPSRFRRTRRLLGGPADAHYLSHAQFVQVREYARDMDRNDWMIGQLVDRATQNTIQSGFKPDPTTPDPELNAELRGRFNDWATDPRQCSLDWNMSFWQMEEFVLRHMFVDGDIFVNPVKGGSGPLELIESQRAHTAGSIRNSRRKKSIIIHGVEINRQTRRRIRYWFSNAEDPRIRTPLLGDMTSLPAFDSEGFPSVLHIYSGKRVTQTRGISAFTPVMDLAGMMEDLNFSNLIRAQFASIVAWFLKREKSTGGDTVLGVREKEQLEDGTTRTLEGISPGILVKGAPGEELMGVSPKVPNPEFFPHMKFIIQAISVNLGIPFVLAVMDASDTNFSGFRGAIDQARMGFRRNQRLLIERFHRPVYIHKVRQFIAEDPKLQKAQEDHGDLIFSHIWRTPGWPYIEPLKDAQADALTLHNMLLSPRDRAAKRGIDFDELVAHTVADNGNAIQAAIERAKAIKKATGVDVTWREVLNQDPPKGLKTTAGNIEGALEPTDA